MPGLIDDAKLPPKRLCQFIVLPAGHEISHCSTSLPTLGNVSLFKVKDASGCAVKCHYSGIFLSVCWTFEYPFL